MHLTRSGTTEMPTTFAEWHALEPIQKSNLFDAWGDLMLVNISDAHLFHTLPPSVVTYKIPDGEDDPVPYIEHHKIEFLYSRVCCLDSEVVGLDLSSAIAPRALDKVEAHLVANNFDFSPTTMHILAQRLELFGISNERLILTPDDFIPLEPFGSWVQPAGRAGASTRNTAGAQEEQEPVYVPDELSLVWPGKIDLRNLFSHGTLGPYAILAGILGPRLRREMRLEHNGQFQISCHSPHADVCL